MSFPLLSSEWFRSLAALVTGWFLSAINPYIAERRERRKAIALALAQLLGIRSQLFAMESAVTELNKIVTIPPEVEMQLRLIFGNLIPDGKQLAQQYAESVSRVSAIDPLLGSKLQSKNEVQPVLNAMSALVVQSRDTQAATMWKKMHSVILRHIESDLNELIDMLAAKRSLWTRWKTRRLLSDSRELPKGTEAVLELLRTEIAKAQTTPTAEPQQQAASAAGTVTG